MMKQDSYEEYGKDSLNYTLQIDKVDDVVQRLLRDNQREYDIYVVRERVREITEIFSSDSTAFRLPTLELRPLKICLSRLLRVLVRRV